MKPEEVTVVRSGPSFERMQIMPRDPLLRNGREYIVGYFGVMGRQERIDHLLEGVKYLVHEKGRRDIQFILVGGGTELEAMKIFLE